MKIKYLSVLLYLSIAYQQNILKLKIFVEHTIEKWINSNHDMG
jgi:hypothetical protein